VPAQTGRSNDLSDRRCWRSRPGDPGLLARISAWTKSTTGECTTECGVAGRRRAWHPGYPSSRIRMAASHVAVLTNGLASASGKRYLRASRRTGLARHATAHPAGRFHGSSTPESALAEASSGLRITASAASCVAHPGRQAARAVQRGICAAGWPGSPPAPDRFLAGASVHSVSPKPAGRRASTVRGRQREAADAASSGRAGALAVPCRSVGSTRAISAVGQSTLHLFHLFALFG